MLRFCRIIYGTPEYEMVLRLRDEQLRRPLGLTLYDSDLSADRTDIHLCARLDREIVGSLILSKLDDSTFKIRQVAVREDLRGLGIGRRLLRFGERVARKNGAHTLVLHGRKTAIGFYEKLGYTAIGGEFYEVGLSHRKMVKELE